jgi:hypothetical protein
MVATVGATVVLLTAFLLTHVSTLSLRRNLKAKNCGRQAMSREM